LLDGLLDVAPWLPDGHNREGSGLSILIFWREVLGVLVRNRSEASHFAGGLVLNAPEDSARYSHDFDVFREAVDELVAASEKVCRPSLRGCWPVMRALPGTAC